MFWTLAWGTVDAVHAGLEYKPDDVWAFRLGGAWMSAGMPDYSPPSMPDGVGWIVTGGVGCQVAKHTYFDLGAGYYFADRRIPAGARNIGAGDVDLNGLMLGISIRQEF